VGAFGIHLPNDVAGAVDAVDGGHDGHAGAAPGSGISTAHLKSNRDLKGLLKIHQGFEKGSLKRNQIHRRGSTCSRSGSGARPR
jgi:hypothetical protein